PQTAIRYANRSIGEMAPRFTLQDLSNSIVKMEDLLGSPTLLLFWHPHCKFCRAMYDDLVRWEENPPVGAPKLVFITCGEIDDIKDINRNFKSLTLLDPEFELAPLFGTKHTPSAILVDGAGRIQSSLAIGDQNVRALMGLQQAELTV